MKTILLLIMTLTATIAFGWNIPPADKEEAYLYYKNKTINPGFENGTTNFTASGGSFTVTTTAADVGEGARAGVFNASAASQTLSGTNYTIERALYGSNGYAKCEFRTTATDYKIQVHDGTNVIVEQTLVPSTNYLEQGVNFVFPSSGTARLRVISASDSADLFIDDCYIGMAPNNSITSFTQNQLVGSAYIAGTASCSYSRTNTSFGAFGTTAACPGPTVEVNSGPGIIQTTDTDLPRFTVNDLEPGTYEVGIYATFRSDTNGARADLTINDGTTSSGRAQGSAATGANDLTPGTVIGIFNYTTKANRTFEIYGLSSSGTVTIFGDAAYQTRFWIKRYPLPSQVAFRADTIATSWAGYHDSTCAWSTTSTSFVTPSADGSCGFTERSNTNFGTVASTGSKTPGLTFTPLRPGKYRVCASTQLLNDTTFAYARLRLTDGTNTLGEASARSSNGSVGYPATICGIVTASNTSLVTLNLQANASSNTTLYGAYDNGTSAIDWTISAIDQQVPAPVLVGSVSAPLATTALGVATVTFGGASEPQNCTGSPCTINRQSGPIASVTRGGTGNYTINFTAGAFSGIPMCVGSGLQVGTGGLIFEPGGSVPTATAYTFNSRNTALSGTDGYWSVSCWATR
jgi:hypothetical protein